MSLETVEMKKYVNRKLWNPKILCWEGVVFLYKAFTKLGDLGLEAVNIEKYLQSGIL